MVVYGRNYYIKLVMIQNIRISHMVAGISTTMWLMGMMIHMITNYLILTRIFGHTGPHVSIIKVMVRKITSASAYIQINHMFSGTTVKEGKIPCCLSKQPDGLKQGLVGTYPIFHRLDYNQIG